MDNITSFNNKYPYRNYSNYNQNYYQPGIDTTLISTIKYRQIIDQVGLEVAYLFRSPEFWRRFSLFGGIGGGLSYSVYSKIQEDVNVFTGKNATIHTMATLTLIILLR